MFGGLCTAKLIAGKSVWPTSGMHTLARILGCGVALLLLFAGLAVPFTASAAMEKPVWTGGDFWAYSFSSTSGGTTTTGSIRMDVTGAESVTVNGTLYPTYHVDATLTIPFGSLSFTIPADLWFSTDTLAIVQLTAVVNLTFGNVSAETTLTISGNPPQRIQWPLAAGAAWSSTTIVWVAARSSNGTTEYSSQGVTTDFAVLADETVSVPAGNFTATPLRETSTANGTYSVNYWSAAVGNWALVGFYDSSGVEQSSLRLTSFGYQGPGFFGQVFLGLSILVWLILVFVVIAAVVVVLALRRRKPPAAVSIPPYPEPPQIPPEGPPR